MGIRFTSFFSPWILPPVDDLPTDRYTIVGNAALHGMDNNKNLDTCIRLGYVSENGGCYINDTFIPEGTEIILDSEV